MSRNPRTRHAVLAQMKSHARARFGNMVTDTFKIGFGLVGNDKQSSAFGFRQSRYFASRRSNTRWQAWPVQR